MRKTLLVFMFLIIGVFSVINAEKAPRPEIITVAEVTNFVHKDALKQKTSLNKVNDPFLGGILFFEDFEPGGVWHRWTSEDLTDPQPERGDTYWGLTTWMALGDSCWHMADTSLGDNGGYDNHWYQVLDTRLIEVSDTNAVFSFYHRFSLETPGGADAPYDAWDGINVRVSTDSGATWQVLPFESYTDTCNWAFGHPDQGMFEGVGIASWSGLQETWRKEEISLKSYVQANRALMIRFAFASDLGFSTANNGEGDEGDPTMFGWQIDSILISSANNTYFFNDGQAKDMVGKDNVFLPPVGGDLWHIAEIPNDMPFYEDGAPSPSHAAVLQNSGSIYDPMATYNPWMDNVFITGPISIPDTTPVYLDYKIFPFTLDEDDYPNLEYFRWEARPVDSTEWDWLDDEPYVSDYSGDHWTEFSKAPDYWVDQQGNYVQFATNTSADELSHKFRGQDVYLRFRFWSDYDQPLGPGLMIDDIVVYAPINPPDAPTGLTVTGSAQDTTITVRWDFKDDLIYQVWRQIPGDQYIYRIAEVKDSVYVDTDIDFYQEYYYTLKALKKYEGTSDFVDPMLGTQIVPATIKEFGYDDGIADTTVVAATNKLVYVKFTPPYYPIDVKGLNVFLVKDGSGTAAQFSMWDDDGEGGTPGTQLRIFNKSGMPEGWYKIIFDDSTAIDSGSFWVGYKRFGGGPSAGRLLGADTSAEISGNTYLQTDSTLFQITDRDAMVHIFMDSSRADLTGIEKYTNRIANEFMLGANYPNPFNPITTIPFIVPSNSANQTLTLTVYNLLGQKVATLFQGKTQAGYHTVNWDGLNSTGKSVSSGIYLYQLKGKNISLTNRMLLLK